MFLHPLGLLSLIGLPIVVGLHLYRRRFQRREVSALFLWAPKDTTPVAGRKREPLRKSASLLAELLAALCLALAFGGLRGCTAGTVQHLVVVLDGSASMGSTTSGGSTLERAREALRERLESLSADSRVTLVVSGPRPEVLVGPAAFRGEAQAALLDFAPGHVHHDLEPAVSLAEQLSESGRVLVISDRFEPGRLPESAELLSIGEPAPNLAVVSAARTAAADGMDEIRLSVISFGGAAISTELRATWSTGDAPAAGKRLGFDLQPGVPRSITFEVPSQAGVVQASLPADALTIDNDAFLAPRQKRELWLAADLEEDFAQSLNLGREGPIDRWLELLPNVREVPAANAHLILTDKASAPAGAWTMGFTPSASKEESGVFVGPFLLDRSTQLLSGMTLEGITWVTADSEPLAGVPLVSAGNRPLLVERLRGNERHFELDLSPAYSSLMRSPDWPILLTNVAEMRRAALPGPARTNMVLGEALVFRDSEPARYRLQGEDESREVRARGLLVLDDPMGPGAYELIRLEESGERRVASIAWSFVDAGESNLLDCASGKHKPEVQPRPDVVRASHSPIEVLLLALALGLGLLDWFVLAPRRRKV
ncbi:MAG: hypothetical protein ACI8QC_004377 [Planctomycetota bacterium]